MDAMKRNRQSLWICAAASVMAATMIGASTMMSKAAGGVGCKIRSQGTGEGSKLEAIISGSGPVKGTYEFTVQRSGKSEPEQDAGEFEIPSAERTEVKKKMITLAAGESYQAQLDIQWPGGASSCSASGG
jgi:hypothetical protein